MRAFCGRLAGDIGAAGILVGLVGIGLSAAIMGVGLLVLVLRWFVAAVVR